MSKTYFTIAEQKQKIINFIKKHKDMLGVPESGMNITAEYLDKLENASNKEFFRLANQVKLKFGRNFFIFSYDCYETHHMIEIWLPIDLNKIASDKAIKEFCDSNDFEDVIENSCYWYNMTPKRWETFEAVFDFYDKPKASKKTVKKTAKKAKKIVKPKEVKLSDSAILKDEVVFIDFEADEFNHLMGQGGSNIAVYIDNKSECDTKNQIDHLINAFKLAKKEADTFIELLETAKKNGAKHVVDSSYTTVTKFNFTK